MQKEEPIQQQLQKVVGTTMIIIPSDNEQDHKLYANFIHSIKSQVTREHYWKNLKYYMKFLGVKTLRELVDTKNKPQKIIESDIKEYLVYLRTKKRISYGAAHMYLAPIRKFYYVNTDYQFKWDLINLYLGNDDEDLEEEEQQDRPYTIQEIRTMLASTQEIRVK